MKFEKTITIERTVIDHVVCDLCNRKDDDWEARDGWSVEETEISYRSGTSYPETSWGTKYTVDICPTCFKEKLIPWLEEQGATVTEEEWDW